MAGKNIEIKMGVVGAEQAAAQIEQVSTAMTDTSTAAKKMTKEELFGPELAKQFAEAREKADDLSDAVKNTGDALEENVGSIDKRGRAQALAGLAQGLGQVGVFAKEAADELRDANPAMAGAMDDVSKSLGRMSSATSLAAQGFAVGGPLGAGIGALAGLVMPEFMDAAEDLSKSLGHLAEAEKAANELTGRLSKETRMGAEAYRAAVEASETYKQRTDDLARSLDVQSTALKNRNALLAAKDETAAAKRDAADAQLIRNGAAPEDVEAARVKHDAEMKIDAMRRELEEANNAQQSAASIRDQAQENIRSIKSDPRGVDADALKNAEAAANNAQRAYEDATSKALSQLQILNEKKQSVNQSSDNRVAELQDSKTKRLADEKQKADEKAAREAEKKQREEEREKEKAQREEAKRFNAGRDLETDIVGLGEDAADATRGIGARGINPEGFNVLARKIAKKGDSAGDKAGLSKMLATLGLLIDKIPESKSGSEEAQELREVQRKMEKKLAALESQIKNTRPLNK
jgi:hypothetical protein